MSSSTVDFIRRNTALTAIDVGGAAPIHMHLASEITPIWHATEAWLAQHNVPPPYWAFAWPGGQGMARYILENPELVRGKVVLDFAAGSGIAAIAARMAGAARVIAADIDPMAQVAVQMNAARNGVAVEVSRTIDLARVFKPAEVILTADVCYEHTMSYCIWRWLQLAAGEGQTVILADPGRAYVPEKGLDRLTQYVVPVLRDLEDSDTRDVTIWRVLESEN